MATPPVFSAGAVLTAGQMNAVGLWLVSNTSFTTTTNHDVSNVFTSDFANYQCWITITAISASDTVMFQYRDGSGPYTATNYDSQIMYGNGTTVAASVDMALSKQRIGYMYTTPGYGQAVLNLFNPQSSTLRSMYTVQASSVNGTTNGITETGGGGVRVTNSFTGIRLTTFGGTAQLTGSIRIYGCRD